MKITKLQIKKLIREEMSKVLREADEYVDLRDYGVEEDPRSPQEHKQEELNNILKKLSNPKQSEHVKVALNASGVFELDPIEDKREIKSIINNLRARNADEVLDFILVQIADEVLKVNV